ncbi:hypothetical protein [Paraburkholderia youngii]|uniref:hypothetical protein n=1 Tax=Paraburkholderia youngii TaxID=2782701 RepID=UPI00159599CA|nr:hypothetical protein [Paraburkholderia youngii]
MPAARPVSLRPRLPYAFEQADAPAAPLPESGEALDIHAQRAAARASEARASRQPVQDEARSMHAPRGAPDEARDGWAASMTRNEGPLTRDGIRRDDARRATPDPIDAMPLAPAVRPPAPERRAADVRVSPDIRAQQRGLAAMPGTTRSDATAPPPSSLPTLAHAPVSHAAPAASLDGPRRDSFPAASGDAAIGATPAPRLAATPAPRLESQRAGRAPHDLQNVALLQPGATGAAPSLRPLAVPSARVVTGAPLFAPAPAPEPVIEIHIGRVDIRAQVAREGAAATPAPARRDEPSATDPLAAYLGRRSRGARS